MPCHSRSDRLRQPGRETAIVALGAIRKEISVALLDSAALGDFVLVHVGFALHKVSPEEAERTLADDPRGGRGAERPASRRGRA